DFSKEGIEDIGSHRSSVLGMTVPEVGPISYLQSRKESMSEAALDVRRKKLRWRSWHRGTREMDLLLGSFADAHLADLSEEQLDRFEKLLEAADPDLYCWLLGRDMPPPGIDRDILNMMRNFKFAPRSG